MTSVRAERDAPCPVDFGSETFLSDPWPTYRWLQEHDPVHHVPTSNAHLVVRHEDVVRTLADRRLVTDFPIRVSRRVFGPSLLDVDGPRHRSLRRMLGPLLGRGPVGGPGVEMITSVVDEVLAGLPRHGPLDVTRDVAVPVPYGIATRLTGLPPTDPRWLRARITPLARAVDFPAGSLEQAAQAREELGGYVRRAVRAGAVPRDRPTLLGLLARSGATPDDPGFLGTVLLFLLASTETSVSTIGTVLQTVLRYCAPDGFWSDREVRHAAVRETLRLEPPTHTVLRYAASDVTIAGTTITRHGAVLLSLAAANRDERAFADPDRWWPQRPAGRSLAFGAGPHACLGIHLAHAEFDVLFARLGASGAGELRGRTPVPMRGHGFRGPRELTIDRVTPGGDRG